MNIKNKGLLKMILVGIVILVVGIIVINHTDSFLKIVMIAAGLGTFIDGLYTLNGTKKWKYTDTTKKLAMAKGIESIAIGVAAVLIAIFAADTALTVMVYIFAIGLVFSSVVALSNGEWLNDDTYATKNYRYSVFISPVSYGVEIYTTSDSNYYILVYSKDRDENECWDGNTDMGKYICHHLESQGWQYRDGDY